MELSFKGKTVAITGASEGIGFACAEVFGKLGANVAICARNIEKLKDAENKLKRTSVICC